LIDQTAAWTWRGSSKTQFASRTCLAEFGPADVAAHCGEAAVAQGVPLRGAGRFAPGLLGPQRGRRAVVRRPVCGQCVVGAPPKVRKRCCLLGSPVALCGARSPQEGRGFESRRCTDIQVSAAGLTERRRLRPEDPHVSSVGSPPPSWRKPPVAGPSRQRPHWRRLTSAAILSRVLGLASATRMVVARPPPKPDAGSDAYCGR
jgi:hypothetical protein